MRSNAELNIDVFRIWQSLSVCFSPTDEIPSSSKFSIVPFGRIATQQRTYHNIDSKSVNKFSGVSENASPKTCDKH